MPYKSYEQSFCDECGCAIYGGCPENDGIPENNGLIFCGAECKNIHLETVENTKKWFSKIGKTYKDQRINREVYKQYCFGCKNFMNLEPQGPRKGAWYNHVCIVSEKLSYNGNNGSGQTFNSCKNAFCKCFKNREVIETEILELSRFELMDFEE